MNIFNTEQWYVALIMCAVSIVFAVYFIIIKRWKRFEWTILLCMFIKYAINAYIATEAF